MRLALFDLDGTVLRANSWHAYFWWTVRGRPALAPELLLRLALRRAGLLSAGALQTAALAPLRGREAAAVAEVGRRIFAERLREQIRPRARWEIARARTAGCEPVLATGAFDFLVEPVAVELGVKEIVCTRLGFERGRCLGRVAGEATRGAAKAAAVRARFAERDVDWAGSRAYSDELEDAPLFGLVGEAVLVASGARRPQLPSANIRVADWDRDGAPGQ